VQEELQKLEEEKQGLAIKERKLEEEREQQARLLAELQKVDEERKRVELLKMEEVRKLREMRLEEGRILQEERQRLLEEESRLQIEMRQEEAEMKERGRLELLAETDRLAKGASMIEELRQGDEAHWTAVLKLVLRFLVVLLLVYAARHGWNHSLATTQGTFSDFSPQQSPESSALEIQHELESSGSDLLHAPAPGGLETAQIPQLPAVHIYDWRIPSALSEPDIRIYDWEIPSVLLEPSTESPAMINFTELMEGMSGVDVNYPAGYAQHE